MDGKILKHIPQTVYFASHNQHKAEELSNIISTYGSLSLASASGVAPGLQWVENASTFRGNALIKAQALRQHTKAPILADDSGLVVDALDGGPGIHSKRFAGPDATDLDNLNLLLERLDNLPENKRQARFICCLIYLDEQGQAHEFQGTLEGHIATQTVGTEGFGYDPIFVPAGATQTLAQYSHLEKNAMSHRAKAAQKWGQWLFS